MKKDSMNDLVAREFSDALARCHKQGIDAGTVRTGLLTIAIANFVNGIGLSNTITLFAALPEHIRAGMFDRFLNPVHDHNGGNSRSSPISAPPPRALPVAPPPSRRRLI